MNAQASTGTAAHYRSDIDGLRALAVLAVVANHLPEKYFPSGWLGVDVFFVISGFVVTASILRRQPGSLGGFYTDFLSRRVKRLLPALIACVAVTAGVVWLVDPLPSSSFKTGIAALFGMSNVALTYLEMDYFANSTRYNAFTHTWSLGVEEQFYLVYPLVLWFGYFMVRSKGERSLAVLLGVLSALSLAAFLLLAKAYPTLVYYMMPTRFWELGLGALTFLLCSRLPEARGGWFASLLPVLALVGLVATFFAPADMAALATVVAVALTCVLLARPAQGPGQAILEAGPARYVGKISYSLYLWHWPVVSVGPLVLLGTGISSQVFIPAMFVFAILSYHLLEKPLRMATWSKSSLQVLLRGGAVSVAAAGAVVALGLSPNPDMLDFYPVSEKLAKPGKTYRDTCVVSDRSYQLGKTTIEDCTMPSLDDMQPLLWVQGDSHAGHLQGMLRSLRNDTGLGYHLMETVGVGAFNFPGEHPDRISPRTPINAEIEERLQAGDIMVYARLYFKRQKTPPVTLELSAWTERILAWSDQLAEKNVPLVVVAPLPIFVYDDIRDCLQPDLENCSVSRAALVDGMSTVQRQLEDVARRGDNLYVFYPFDWICPESREWCSPREGGDFIYYDADHLNLLGSAKLTDPFLEFLYQEKLIQGMDRPVRHPMRLSSG